MGRFRPAPAGALANRTRTTIHYRRFVYNTMSYTTVECPQMAVQAPSACRGPATHRPPAQASGLFAERARFQHGVNGGQAVVGAERCRGVGGERRVDQGSIERPGRALPVPRLAANLVPEIGRASCR